MSVPPGTIPFNYARPTPTRAEDPNALLQEGQYETSVPTAADRVLQAALKLVLEPIFERISSHRRMASARGAVPRTRSPGDQVALCSCVFTTGAG
jgi:hypothetical protein